MKFNGKGKGTVVTAHAMRACGGMKVQLHSLFNYALNGGEWLASQRGRFSAGESLSETY